MSDEHAPQFSGTYGHPMVRSTRIDQLAGEGVAFDAAYCNSPICVPSRMSFLAGRYIHDIGVFDNTSPLASDVVTWPHLLRAAGYDVVLSGKQHFVGPDQLHGFRAQLARDLHAEMEHPMWLWDDGVAPSPPWRHLGEAGPGTTAEIEADDQAEQAALAYLRDPARHQQPWCLNVSFIAPHFPFIVPQKYWAMYPPEQVDLPQPPDLRREHPAHARMRANYGLTEVSEEQVRRARAGYYGLVTYLDDKIGRLVDTLAETGLAENTVVIYLSDHGEMAGEHGLWRKSNFYEHSVRVPLIIRWPGRLPAGRRVDAGVSLIDVAATLADIAGAQPVSALAGRSLLPLAGGDGGRNDEVFSEYLAHAVTSPTAMLRRDGFKLVYHHGERSELYNLIADPGETTDLAEDPRYRPTLGDLHAALLDRWDPAALDTQVRRSQRERLLIREATQT